MYDYTETYTAVLDIFRLGHDDKDIDHRLHPGASDDKLCQVYSPSSLVDSRNKHVLAVVYRVSACTDGQQPRKSVS